MAQMRSLDETRDCDGWPDSENRQATHAGDIVLDILAFSLVTSLGGRVCLQ